ncbi:MAG: glycoside hydrolase [Halothiobacillaceae bacterium]
MSAEHDAMASRLHVVLLWHMHQPEYRDPFSGQYQRPWTYLHAIKDYVDMAAHLEAHPEAHAVVNFVPVLLEQIADYAGALRAHLDSKDVLPDPLLAALASGDVPAAVEGRAALIEACLKAHEQRLIQRFAPYARLARIARDFLAHPEGLVYLDRSFFIDLNVWYHLAWLGESVRRQDARARRLIHKASGFDAEDRRQLLELLADLLGGVIERYRQLAECGQVELSMTPYAHPIMPLLLDMNSAREAWPEVVLPKTDHYPGGEARVRWHLQEGLRVFERFFGCQPAGCWPSEGSLSERTLPLLAEAGFRWCATGSQVLHNSLHQAGLFENYRHCLHRFYQYSMNGHGGDGNGVAKAMPTLFFRDDGLSDLIGFRYADWHADHAVEDLVRHLETIADACHDGQYVASIIMDGENAWEYYPENGYYFLDALYRRLVEHPRLHLTTYQKLLDEAPPITPIPRLVAGSWVYGTFSTWIGEKDKNHAWMLLVEAKKVYDRVVASGRLTDEQLAACERQLGICEGSDWFWWFGDYNPADAVRDFERLFRLHLRRLYELLGEPPPEVLKHVLAEGHGAPSMGGVMRTGQVG